MSHKGTKRKITNSLCKEPFPSNVIMMALGPYTSVPINPDEAFEYVINSIDVPRIQEFIDLKYKRHLTFAQVADEMGIKRHQAVHINIRLLEELQHPSNAAILKMGINKGEEYLAGVYGDKYNVPVEALKLSTRPMNAITHYTTCKTSGDLVKKFQDGSINYVSCLGAKSITEIADELKRIGFSEEDVHIDE